MSACLLLAAPAAAQTPIPCYLQGQSNAVYLAAYLSPQDCAVNAERGVTIDKWDWTADGDDGRRGRQMLADLSVYRPVVHVWWQGESDARMSADDYAARLLRVLVTVNRPVMLVEIVARHGREHITAVHQAFGAHPMIAFIPTRDLPRDGDTDHFTPAAYQAVVQRLVACYHAACWQTPATSR
jgi:hypothetical protein